MFILDYFVRSASVLFLNSRELGIDLFRFCTTMLDKETWRKDCWFLFFVCSRVWFLYTAKCQFSSKLRVCIKDSSPPRGSGVTVGLVCSRNVHVSTLGVWTTSQARYWLVNAVGEPYSCPTGFTVLTIQSLTQVILIIPQLDAHKVKNHCRLQDHAHFFYFLVFR